MGLLFEIYLGQGDVLASCISDYYQTENLFHGFIPSFDQISCLDYWCKLKNQQAKLVVLLMQGSVFGVFNFSGRQRNSSRSPIRAGFTQCTLLVLIDFCPV